MDAIILFSAFLVVETSLAFKIPDSGSAVANLWSGFEVQLQDALFQSLDRHERPRRDVPHQDIWTGFVPDLYQHREQLVVDSVEILSSNQEVQCQDGDMVLLDSMQYRRQYYTSVTCGDLLTLYRLNSSTLENLDNKFLNEAAVSVNHFKLFDPKSGEVVLFVLVLTKKTIEIFKVNKDKLDLVANQQLIHEFSDVKVFEVNGVVYCTLVKKNEDSRIKLGIFELVFSGSSVDFSLVTSTTFNEGSPIRVCAVDGQAHMFHSDVARARLNVHIFDSSQNQIEHHQIIEAGKITDFQCFRIGSTHYLAFATLDLMKIFQYVDGFYEELQILNMKGIVTIKPLSPPTYRDETFLLVNGFANEEFVDLLVLDALSLTFLPVNASCSNENEWEKLPHKLELPDFSCLTTVGNVDATSLTSIVLDDQLFLVVSDRSSKMLLLSVNVHLESVENLVAQQLVGVQARMEATTSAVQNFANRSREFVEFSKGIVLYDTEVKVEGSWEIGTIEVPEVALERLDQTIVDFNPEVWIPGLDIIVDDIQKKMNELERLLNSIDDRLQGTILNGTNDSVEFNQLTIDGSLLINQIEVTKLSVEKLNGLDFDDVMADIVRRDSDRLIESLKVMGTLTTDALTADRVNDIAVKDVVIRSDESIEIIGNLTINNNVTVFQNVTVGGTVNGIDLSEQLLMPNDTHGSIIFIDSLSVGNLSVNEFLNGVEAKKVLPNVVVNQTIDAHLDKVHFEHLVIDGDLDIKSGIVNDIDIAALNASALRLDADEVVEGNIVFTKGIIAENGLKVVTINGVEFTDFVLKNNNLDNIIMTGEKIFLGNVTARSLLVASTVNGHHLHNALTLDTNQSLEGNVYFMNGFEVPTGDLSIQTLNDVDWESIRKKGVHPAIFEKHGLEKNVTIRNLCSIGGSLSTSHFKVNGESLDDILSDIVYTNGDDIVITGEKTFSSLKVNGLQVEGYINGLKVLDEILTASTDQIITGTYDFQGYVDFSSLDVRGTLNGYNLDELFGSVLQFDGDLETVTCRLRFNHIDVSGQVLVNGSINGFPTELMVLDGVDQTFTAPQKLISPGFSSLTIKGHLNLTDPRSRINGIDLDLFDRRRVTIFTDQWIKADWRLGSLEADSLSFRTLNGLALDEWNSSFIYTHSPENQTLEAKGFNLDLLQVHGNIVTNFNEISGHNLRALSKVAGDIRKNLTFNGNVTFEQLESQQIHVAGNVNHYSIQHLEKDVVYRNQTPLITGVKTFQKLRVNGNVDVDLINGRRLIDSFLHVSADQKIETSIRFTDQVTAGDLQLAGDTATLNGVPKQLLFSSDHSLDYNIHKGDVVIKQSIDVKSLEILSLQNENFDDLVSSLARLNETNEFNASVTFTNPVQIEGDLTVGKLNEVDIKKFAEDVVLVDVDANITSSKVFDKLETVKLSTRSVQSNSVYPDVMGAAAQAIRLDINETVNGTIQFEAIAIERNINSSTLNGQPFPAGYVTLDSNQELPESMVIDKITMLGDIILEDGARVNGFDLKAECANTWMVDGVDKIQSNKVFQGQVKLLSNLTVNQKVNGVANFDGEVVLLATGGTIYGAPHFSDVSIGGDVVNVGHTNDIDLADLAMRALYLDSPIKTDGAWSMPMASLHGGSFLLPAEAKINMKNVGQLSGAINEPRLLKVEEGNIYEAALQWRDALRNAYFKMDHLDLNQTIFLPHQVTALSELQINGTSILFVGTRGGSIIYRRQPTESSYVLAAIPVGTGNVSKWLPLAPDFAASLSTSGTQLWQISSVDPFRIELVKDFGTNVVDITDEAIQGLRFSGTKPNSTVSIDGLQVYERLKTPAEISNSLFNSDVKMHNFRLGSRSMIALIMTFSAEVSANVVGCPGVRLYSTSTGSMKLEHIIPACDVRAITTFSHGNLPDNYLLLAEHESVTVYHYEGASGYRERFRMPYPAASALHSWTVKSGSETDLFVAVGKADRVAIHRGVTVGDYIGD